MAIAKVFGSLKPELADRFTQTALFTLSEPGVPQSLREFAAEQAGNGVQVTTSLVQEWLKAYRDSPKAPLNLAQKEAPLAVDPDEVHAAENWRLVVGLLSAAAPCICRLGRMPTRASTICGYTASTSTRRARGGQRPTRASRV